MYRHSRWQEAPLKCVCYPPIIREEEEKVQNSDTNVYLPLIAKKDDTITQTIVEVFHQKTKKLELVLSQFQFGPVRSELLNLKSSIFAAYILELLTPRCINDIISF